MIKCRACQSTNKKKLFSKYDYPIVKCQDCSLVYTDFSPAKNFFQDFYQEDYFIKGGNKRSYDNYAAERKSLTQTFQKRVEYLAINESQSGQVLDVGCAYGYFLKQIPNSWDKFGLEVSSHAAGQARKNNPQAKIITGKLTPDAFSDYQFDLITLWDVIEHLNQPRKDLEIIFDRLKPAGKIALSTGDVNSLLAKISGKHWHLYNPPQHLSYFSSQTISQLLSDIGYVDIKIIHPPAYYPISYLTHKIDNLYGIKLSLPKKISSIIVPINLWDIMLVTAQKPN